MPVHGVLNLAGDIPALLQRAATIGEFGEMSNLVLQVAVLCWIMHLWLHCRG